MHKREKKNIPALGLKIASQKRRANKSLISKSISSSIRNLVGSQKLIQSSFIDTRFTFPDNPICDQKILE